MLSYKAISLFLAILISKATSRGSFRHLRGPQYQNGPQKWTPRPKIDRKLPPKLFCRTYLGLYQHRVDVETGSLCKIPPKIQHHCGKLMQIRCQRGAGTKMHKCLVGNKPCFERCLSCFKKYLSLSIDN